MRHGPAAVAAALLALTLSVPAARAEARLLTLEHGGVERRALLEAAPGLREAPVLVVLHGGIAGPEWLRRRARIGLAREGWVVVWPYALDDWNDGRRDARGRLYDAADDLGFLRRLVAGLAEAGVADPERVYFAGPSLGGTMVLRLLCEAPDLVAGAAVAISALPEGADCPEGPPRPVLYMHGTADRIMPPEGGAIGGDSLFVRDRGRVEPVAETVAMLAARNGCAGAAEARRLPDRAPEDGSTVRVEAYRDCAAPLVHYVVEGGGHSWPDTAGGGGAPDWLVGATNRDFSATRAVEGFLRDLAGAETRRP